ncbi:MAG TPA: hypothetical protein VGC76_11180 [Pyrinomonadaceae bacterium]|jgi:hypothetical protein
METIVYVLIKGVAICYKKDNLWKILFPFDDCHSVKLSYKTGTREVFLGHFGQAKGKIEIITNQAAFPPQSSGEFDHEVVNLTDAGVTHQSIVPKSGWDSKGILLTIQNANFDVKNRLEDFPEAIAGLDIFLTDRNVDKKFGENEHIAHSVEAKIQLSENEFVKVNIGRTELFTTEPGNTYNLIFDNDCDKPLKAPKRNDMEMFYELIEEPNDRSRKFVVEGRPKHGTPTPKSNRNEPPDLLQGKPCLVVKASKGDQLP